MNNKDLDRLFQEKLKNLEATPNKKVWNTIESKLKKTKRRVIPFWWFLSGVVALLLFGVFLFPLSGDAILDSNDYKTIITKAPKKTKETINVLPKVDSIIQQKKDEEKVWVANEKLTLKKIIAKKKNNFKNFDEEEKLISKKNAMEKIFLAKNSSRIKKEPTILSKKKMDNLSKKNNSENPKNNVIEKKKTKNNVDFSKYIKKNDTIVIINSIKNKWAIAPVFGVLSSNSFSNSSPLEESLSNSTIGKSSYSFGIQVGYKINKKWSIQTGIHKQEISYANNKVIAISSVLSSGSVVSLNNNSAVFLENSRNSDFLLNSSINSPKLIGDLNQTFGYIEIPFEVKYRFLNSKKFDSQIIAGFSSLFLNKNEINLKTPFQSEYGKVNNLNNLNFSGNFGFDFNYLISKKWAINLNPMFKAQLNTFSHNANGFSPFNIGIYTGLKYRF